MRVLLIHTPIAGSGLGREALTNAQARLAPTLVQADGIGQAQQAASAAGGYDIVVAAGGDGTVHEVVNGLMALPEPRPVLGILPLGTGNDVARNLAMVQPAEALGAIEHGTHRRLDLIRVEMGEPGDRRTAYGVLNCGIGLGAAVVRATTPTVKRWFGEQAYNVGTLRALVAWHSPVMHVEHDGGAFEGRVLFLAVGNGEWEGGGAMRVSPGARMDDGLLNVLLIRHGSKLEVLRNFGRLATGEHIHHRLVDYFTTTRLAVSSASPLEVQTDGDVVGRAPVVAAVAPAAIAVCAPAP